MSDRKTEEERMNREEEREPKEEGGGVVKERESAEPLKLGNSQVLALKTTADIL